MRLVVISGCSGGGKSTIIEEFRTRGYSVVEEPGRRIIAQESAANGDALPWVSMKAFAGRAIEMALADRSAAMKQAGPVLFDRSLVDAAAALEHATGQPELDRWCPNNPYYPVVFIAPPWPEIYRADNDRRHDFTSACDEYERLLAAYGRLGYEIAVLPNISIRELADLILCRLGD